MLRNVFFFLFFTLSLATAAFAYPNCSGHPSCQDFMSGLSPEQQEKVTKVTGDHHKELFALKKDLEAKEDALDALLAVLPIDKAAVDQALEQANALRARMARLRVDYQIALAEIAGKPVLTKGSACASGKPHGAPCSRGAADSGPKAAQPQ